MSEFIDIKLLEQYLDNGLLIRRTHPNYPISIWNYSRKTEFEDRWDEITMMCRGLVTDDVSGYILARPLRKFFNIKQISINDYPKEFEVYEKMDGYMIILFFAYDQWMVASRGSFISTQSLAAKNILYKNGYKNFDYRFTYLFEYVGPSNRIVINYENDELYLLTAINTHEDYELSYDMLYQVYKSEPFIKVVQRYEGFKDINRLKGLIKENHEGFVLRFIDDERVKVKSEEYFRLHKIVTNYNPIKVWKVLAKGNSIVDNIDNLPDEFFSWIKSIENDLNLKYNKIENEYLEIYKQYKDIVDDKEFALTIKDIPNNKILFFIRKGMKYNDYIWRLIRPNFDDYNN